MIATVKTQFYQVILNRALITVQEEAVHLLESQLKDQQNRFEAGTVPRFNVLQAEVALSNQIPNLISARNAYRISQLTLAKTLGLDFDPLRGVGPPLEVVGELTYVPRDVPLTAAIELGKERRPFLKQARANVLNPNKLSDRKNKGGNKVADGPATCLLGWFTKLPAARQLGNGRRHFGGSDHALAIGSSCFRKPRSRTMMMFGRSSLKCSRHIQICNRTAS